MRIKNLFTYWANQAFSPASALKQKYAAFQALLEQDRQAHELMAELEEIHHEQIRVDFSLIEKKYAALSACVHGIVSGLNRMHPSRYVELKDFYHKIDGFARHMFIGTPDGANPPYCLPLSEITPSMTSLAGEKSMNLAKISQGFNLPTPAGFVITTNAFFRFIHHNRLKSDIDRILSGIDIHDIAALTRCSDKLVRMIQNSTVPPDMAPVILDAFARILESDGRRIRVAVRSSAVGEDSHASFAGQYSTVLNVGKEELLNAYKTVVASKYAPEALVYRINYGLADTQTPMAVLVVEMIDAKAAGVMYTRAVNDAIADLLEVHSVFGLGELLVQGEVTPDLFTVRKRPNPVIAEKKPAAKRTLMRAGPKGHTRVEALAELRQTDPSIDDGSVLTLASWGMRLEEEAEGPLDIEWCMDQRGQLYLLQSRPLRTGDGAAADPECRFDEISNRVLVEGGDRAAAGVASGTVWVALNESDLVNLPDNAVLVTRSASARYVKAMESVSAVIAETGSAAGHFASVAREFGIPTIVNATAATDRLTTGDTVTVYADAGLVYEGVVPALLKNPCIRKRPIADSPFTRKLQYIMGFVSPLSLLDPRAPEFTPGRCRSLHDIIRFAHETATREMFFIGERAFGKSRGAKKLVSHIPMMIYLMDAGGGLATHATAKRAVEPQEIRCAPFIAMWKGLTHPGIQWGGFTHFNWAEYDKIVMSGGIISAESAQLASYAVVSGAYLNLNLKFGYHFVIVDTICSDNAADNHILFRFNGGGGDRQGRSLRARFLQTVLQRLAFDVTRTSDLVDARLSGVSPSVVAEKLDQVGRLLGATRLMDMYMDETDQVDAYAEAFLNGRYHFSKVDMGER